MWPFLGQFEGDESAPDVSGDSGGDYFFDQSSGFVDLGDGLLYDPNTGETFDTGQQQSSGDDLFQTLLDDYISQGYDPLTAADLAATDAQSAITQSTLEQGAPPQLPDISMTWLPGIPVTSPVDIQFPIFPGEGPAPPPPLPSSPAMSQPNLPPACPTGQYHPYPIGHPQQNACVPFPAAETQSMPKPTPATGGGSSSGSSGSASKPSSQGCQTGQCKHPVTGQCITIPKGYKADPWTQVCVPIQTQQAQTTQQQTNCPSGYYRASDGQCYPIQKCTTPGTVFDAARGMCVPQAQAISPVSMGIFDELKNIPWWIYLGVAAFFLLSGDGEKRTTITHRRAR